MYQQDRKPLVEFRPGVFARWMEECRLLGGDMLLRFDGRRWRPRNLADTGFCSGPQAAPMCNADRNKGTWQIPPWLKSLAELEP